MDKIKNIAAWLFVALFAVSLLLNVRHYAFTETGQRLYDTTRVTVIDTIPYYKPVAKEEKIVGAVEGFLPLASPKAKHSAADESAPALGGIGVEDIKNSEKSDNIENTEYSFVKEDSASVIIPISQKVYEDSTYKAVVSGYNVSLDEILIFPQKEIITVKQASKPKRWSVGVHAGYGVALKGTPQFVPYVGIGVSYNLFSF